MNGPAPAEYGWWLASRAAGITALVCITVAVGIGLALGGKLASSRPGLPRVLVKIHEHAALAGLIAIAVHAPVAPDPVPVMPCDLEAAFVWSGRSPGQARHFVVDTLAEWGCWALLNDAAVITTELATNAVLHAQSGFTVVVSRRPEGIRIAVRDASLVRPQPRRAGPFETSGRGLRLVAALSARWGSDLVPGGKTIWADLEVPAVIAS